MFIFKYNKESSLTITGLYITTFLLHLRYNVTYRTLVHDIFTPACARYY